MSFWVHRATLMSHSAHDRGGPERSGPPGYHTRPMKSFMQNCKEKLNGWKLLIKFKFNEHQDAPPISSVVLQLVPPVTLS